jgi:hypothetical protein
MLKKILAVGMIAMVLSGCNYQMVDLNYDYDYAIININGEYQKVEIDGWRDYEDGEQLQIIAKDGTVYLTNSFNCTLVKRP